MLSLRAPLFCSYTVTLAVSHNKHILIQVFILTVLEQTMSPEEASYKQTNWLCPTERGQNYVYPSSDNLAPQNEDFFVVVFVRLMQVGIKSSIICLAELSQAVQTHPVPLCSSDQGDLVFVPKIHVCMFQVWKVLRSQVKQHGMRSALPPSESFIMVN